MLPAAGWTPEVEVGAALRLAVAVAAASCALGWAYGLNAIADRATDRSAAKNPLAGLDRVSPAPVAVVVGAGVVALAAAMALSLHAGLAVALSLLAGYAYSYPPRLKALPVLGLLANLVIFAPLLFLAAPDAGFPDGFGTLVVVFVVLLVQNQLVHERADAEEDEAAGDRTTGRLLGRRGTTVALVAVTGMGGVAVVLAWSLRLGLAALPVMAAGVVVSRIGRPDAARRVHRALSLVGGALLWLLAVA